MSQITPTPGRIILYSLSQADVDAIRRRRTDGRSIAERIAEDRWPVGAQAHLGADVQIGDILPGMVVKVWGPTMINAKIELDGTDQLWVTSIDVSDEPTPGKYHWMGYQKAQAAK